MAYNNLIVLTSGLTNSSRGYYPDIDGFVRLGAANILAKDNPDMRFIITGGKFNGSENPSLAAVYGNALTKIYGIDENRIILEEEALNTTQNFNNSIPLLPQGNNAFLTNRWHMGKARAIINKRGNGLEGITAEDILARHGLGTHVQAYERSIQWTYKAMKQRVTEQIVRFPLGEEALLLARRMTLPFLPKK